MPVLDIVQFTRVSEPQFSSVALFTHKVSRGTLFDNPSVVICKEAKSHLFAKVEVIAQEFFRLLIPHQPETRLAKDSNDIHYVLSTEVQGYRKLPKMRANDFANGRITGLGQALLIAMFLQEADAKNGNIGLDEMNRVIKIDGDWCFSEGRYTGSYNLSAESIASLPYPKDFVAFNWLDLINEGVRSPTSTIVQPSLSHAPQFRAEINQAMLMICVLPDRFIDIFIDAYSTDSIAVKLKDILKNRRDALMISALKNASFQAYLDSEEAANDTQSLLNQMRLFQINQQNLVPFEDIETYINAALERKSLLVVREDYLILSAIREHYVGNNDTLMKDYVAKMECRLFFHVQNEAECLDISTELSSMLEILESTEIVSVKNTIEKLRLEADETYIGQFDIEKANKIELALCNIPLRERGTVLTGSMNEVQKMLAITTLAECKKILEAIEACQVSHRDLLVRDFVREHNNLIYPNWDNPDEMVDLKTKLMVVLTSVNSAEIVAVRNEIDRRYAKTSLLSNGQRKKAYRIELALCNTPLLERKNVLTHDGTPNAVQLALASNRIWKKGLTSLNDDNQIVLKKSSSKSLIDLKNQFVDDYQPQEPENEDNSPAM